jgi:N-methylhydantoinase B
MYPFKCALVPDIPNNEGLFRPIHVSAPEGSILNATFPAPVKARAKTTNNMNQVLFGALWSIFGEHAQAGSGSIWPFKFFGEEPGYGRFGVHCLPHGGRGAMRELDGMVPIAFPHNSTVTPTEILELRAPILIEKKELRPDSGGPGRRRGGLGQEIVVRSIATQPMIMLLRPDKMFFNPPGLGEGQSGVVGQVFVNGEEITRFPALPFNPGDELRLLMPGGGGFGDVAEREPELIERDLALGYITPEAAQRDYGYTPDK